MQNWCEYNTASLKFPRIIITAVSKTVPGWLVLNFLRIHLRLLLKLYLHSKEILIQNTKIQYPFKAYFTFVPFLDHTAFLGRNIRRLLQ
jgi:hypothetical protein